MEIFIRLFFTLACDEVVKVVVTRVMSSVSTQHNSFYRPKIFVFSLAVKYCVCYMFACNSPPRHTAGTLERKTTLKNLSSQ